MYDLVNDPLSLKLCAKLFEQGIPVASVCHGPAGLANVKLSNGEYMVKGLKVTGFTNEEETAAGLTKVVPFLLEDLLIANGGKYEKTSDWAPKVVVDGHLITGQNPASAELVGAALDKMIMSAL
jgi:putative intracellular protease/amidase